MKYTNTWESLGVYRKYSGLLTGKIIREAVEKVEGDHRFDTIRYVINDYLNVTDIKISEAELLAIAAIDSVASIYNKRIKIAQVTTRQDIIDLISNYDDELEDNTYETKTFSKLIDARKWITD